VTTTASDLRSLVEAAFADPSRLEQAESRAAVEATIAGLDRGELRLAELVDSDWVVHGWVQQAILLYFRVRQLETWHVGPFEYHDKLPLKHDYARLGVRVVPPAVARFGSFLEPGEYRCARRLGHDGRHLGHGGQRSTDRT
jgi:2,3,4,5-tetrahydropyridine-2-carboxylate N-succinyltransferase